MSERAMTETPAPTPDLLQILGALTWARDATDSQREHARRDRGRLDVEPWDSYVDALRWLASALPALLAAQAESRALRELLWIRHHETTEGLYGDDGELQCSRCMIDFKRDSAERIQQRFLEINAPAIARFFAANPLPCSESTDTNG